VARELGALAVAIVTRPFSFEGHARRRQAEIGVDLLQQSADTVITIPNDRLLKVVDRNTSVVEAFKYADDVLRQGVQGITDLITIPGLINLDFADVRTIVQNAGTALMGVGMGQGDNRALQAAQAAITSPLLETTIEGARGILLNITGGSDLSLYEVNEAAGAIADAADEDANIIFGALMDERLSGSIAVTVIATGFGEAGPVYRPAPEEPSRHEAEPERLEDQGTPLFGAPPSFAEPELDVPSFLRQTQEDGTE
jgi:cell division protein FtsZ